MRKSLVSPFVALGAVFGLVLAMMSGSLAVFGQATPGATPTSGDQAMHPAHIHAGMCPDVGDVVFPLENVVMLGEGASETGMGTPAGSPEVDPMGSPASVNADAMSSPSADDAAMSATPGVADIMGLGSTTVVEASLDDILGAEHAINVHLSPEQLEVYVACGDITGEPENGELIIRMQELNDSGVEGQAILTDNGDGTTTVEIQLRHISSDMTGTPESTPLP